MSLFTAQDIADLESLAEDAMPETATVTHGTWADAGRGGRTWTAGTSFTVACGWMADSRQRGEPLGATGGPEATMDARLRFPAGTDVRTTDHLTIGGLTYEVQGIELRGTTWEAVRIAQVRRVAQVAQVST